MFLLSFLSQMEEQIGEKQITNIMEEYYKNQTWYQLRKTWGNKYFITKNLSKSLVFIMDDGEKDKYVLKPQNICSSPPFK